MQTSDAVKEKARADEAQSSLRVAINEPRKINRIRLDLIDAFDDARPLDEKHVGTLAESIQDHGLLQPVVVIQHGNRFKIPIGNHRKAAAELLGWSHIEAEVWPEGTDPRSVRIKSLHENHVRQNEGVSSTLARVNGVMNDRGCDLIEALRIAKIQGGTASKIKTVYEQLCPEAKQLVQSNRSVGISVAYEVAKGTEDPKTQVHWLNEYLAGRMSRNAIADAAKPMAIKSAKPISLDFKLGDVAVTISYPVASQYQAIIVVLKKLIGSLQTHNKRQTPVDLLPRFISSKESNDVLSKKA
ncbi:ParB/RepB/Spo0J family partition protein [Roseiconus lacunae]|uniref:ParB/RepB/Spo0J family partition protein n=1 Tax=Roseiconus lacunae TaxID=2605694 RepID=UPI001E52985E|nr:ParB N-terminal domain-containing protein [Roseiconus lacunae]MCD0458127.1 ParB N-terminal domain-containing protein [Roseiconus lacunae]